MALLSRRALTGGILGLTILVGSAADLRAETSASRGPAVVELFTSQGCSSCPPADRVLGELATIPNVIALAFHVDYWDNIGWRDPFSISNAVERQHRYVQALNLSSAFTPQASTPVGRGENAGRTLQEFNIVRQFRSIGTWSGRAAMYRAEVNSFPADASRVAVLVQRDGRGPIAGSAVIALR